MSIKLSKKELTDFLKIENKSDKNQVFEGIEYNSNNIKGGELFVALKGETSHGHKFVKGALDKGASLCLVENDFDVKSLEDKYSNDCLIFVNDSLKAFWAITRMWLDKVNPVKAAVTGSMGKTFIKELTSAILLTKDSGNYSIKSYNNHVGVPYTLSRTKESHSWLVQEMGMNHVGEMSSLSKLVSPDVALVSVIAPVHIEFFKDEDEIADAKFEILDGLSTEGTFIYNKDCEHSKKALKRHEAKLPKNVLSFGKDKSADFVLLESKLLGLKGLKIKLSVLGQEIEVSLPVLGEFNAYNVLAAIALAKSAYPSLSAQEIQNACNRFQPPPMRLNQYTLNDGRVLIDDSYNSNPMALKALINFAKSLKGEDVKSGFIVGDMLELGSHALKYHQELAEILATSKPEFVISVGEFKEVFKEACDKANVSAFTADNPKVAALTAEKMKSDVILVKASRGIKLDQSVASLLERIGEAIPSPKFAEGTGFAFKK